MWARVGKKADGRRLFEFQWTIFEMDFRYILTVVQFLSGADENQF